MASTTRDALLKDLTESADLSVRAYNICKDSDLITVRDLYNFIRNLGDFRKIRSCGYKTEKELLIFIKTFYLDSFESEQTVKTEELNKESLISDESFEYLVSLEFEKLTVRAKNALINFMRKDLPDKEFVKTNFIDLSFKARKLRNVGNKTVDEIDDFVKKIIATYFKAQRNEITPNELASLQINEIVGFEVKESFYLEKFISKEFPIIAFTSKYFNEILNVSSLEGEILRNYFQLLDRNYTHDELGKKHSLTRERARQIRNKALEKATTVFSRLYSLIPYSNYTSVLSGKNFIILPESISDKNIHNEIDEAGVIFSAFLLEVISKNNYYSFSSKDKIERPEQVLYYERYNEFKKIRGSYLIKSSDLPKKSLLRLYNILLGEICQKQIGNTSIDLNAALNFKIKPEIDLIISEIIEREFELKLTNGQIHLPRNSAKLIFEYAKEALESIGKPAHISEIISEIKKDYPDFDSAETSLKVGMSNKKQIFIFFGRTSTFGLKSWETKYKNIKGGTIRDIVEEFLEGYDEPCHSSAITEYVKKFRKTVEHSIVNNLKMSGEKRFVFFKDNYVGLVSKNYNKISKAKSKKQTPSNVSLDDLMNSIFLK